MSGSNTIIPFADDIMIRASSYLSHPSVILLAKALSSLISEPVLFLIALMLYWGFNSKKTFPICISIMSLFFLSVILKDLFQENRPPVTHFEYATGFSFPSTHALTATLAAGFLSKSFNSRFLTKILYTLAIGICLSRVILGVHYVHDVLISALAGILFLYFFYKYEASVADYILSGHHVIKVLVIAAMMVYSWFFGSPVEIKLSAAMTGFWLGHSFRKDHKPVVMLSKIGAFRFITGILGILGINIGMKALANGFLLSEKIDWIARYSLIFIWISLLFPILMQVKFFREAQART